MRASMYHGQRSRGGQSPHCLRSRLAVLRRCLESRHQRSVMQRASWTCYVFNAHTWAVFDQAGGKPQGMIDHDDLFKTQLFAAGFTPPQRPVDPPASAAVEAAERTSRSWTSTHVGALRPGSDAHKREVCRMFHETFNPYRPSVIAWPKLSPAMLQRITSLPIWDVAVHTESRARLRFAVYANAVDDPQVQAAVMLNAWEESRHKEVLAKLVEAYGIPLASEPPFQQPRDPEWAYLITGYCECIDSFFAFGLFELARRSGFFPAELVETSSPSSRRNAATSCCLPIWWHGTVQICRGGDASTSSFASRRFGPSLPGSASCWRAAWTRKGDKARLDSSFTASTAGAVSPVEIDVRDLMTIACKENDRRFSGYDSRLLRPTTVPALARLRSSSRGRGQGRRRHRPRASLGADTGHGREPPIPL